MHAINAQYSGDATFLSSSDRIPLQVNGIATTSTLAAPADAAPGSSMTLTATINVGRRNTHRAKLCFSMEEQIWDLLH